MEAPKANILRASAGAGKTYRLAYEYILSALGDHRYTDADGEDRRGFDPYIYREILAVTFTNKATAEMKGRILGQIDTLAKGGKSDYLDKLISDTGLDEKELRRRARILRTKILHDYSHFTILTNDTFFQRILRAFIKEIGMEMNFSIELDGTSILDQGADRIIEQTEDDPRLGSWIMEFSRERIEDGRNWDIKSGILSLRNEIFKEEIRRTLERKVDRESIWKDVSGFIGRTEAKIANLKSERESIFSRMAADGVTSECFSSKYSVLRKIEAFPEIATKDFDIIRKFADEDEDIGKYLLKQFRDDPTVLRHTESLRDLADGMVHMEGDILSSDMLRRNFRSYALMQDLYGKAMEICRESNTMLLSETKHIISSFISEQDAPFIYEKVGSRFSRFFIDEFQDTSVQEWRNFLPLLREAMSKCEETSVLLVGDVKQSIYRWRGGDWKILSEQARRDLEQDSVGEVAISSIEDNWRSRREIVEFNNSLFEDIVHDENEYLNGQIAKGLDDETISVETATELKDAISDAYSTLHQTPRLHSEHSGYVGIYGLGEDEEPNVKGLVDKLIDEGYRPCDITILVRTRREGDQVVRDIASAKAAERESTGKVRHDFDIMTQDALGLWKSRAVQFIASTMCVAADRNDTVSMAVFTETVHGSCLQAPSEEETAFLDRISVMSPEEAFESIIHRYGHLFENSSAYIQALHETVVRHSFTQTSDLESWNRWWSENKFNRSVTAERSDNTVEIMTIHKAKGLENRVIIIPYCSWTLDPSSYNNIIWAEPDRGANVTSIDKFPIPFSQSVQSSIFSDEYFRETVFSHVDAVNTLYVAFTRPTERLYAFIPEKRGDNVGKRIIDLLGRRSEDGEKAGEDSFEFHVGEEVPPTAKAREREESIFIDRYVSTPSSTRLKLSTDIYTDADSRLTPRREGIELHRVFQNSESEEDIVQAIDRMTANGDISPSKAEAIRFNVREALGKEPCSEWFSGKWDTVRNESGILSDSMIHRPDRVMIRGKKATIVDYKFGRRSDSHRRQVMDYIMLLRRMGYTDITGYIWYVTLGEMDKV